MAVTNNAASNGTGRRRGRPPKVQPQPQAEGVPTTKTTFTPDPNQPVSGQPSNRNGQDTGKTKNDFWLVLKKIMSVFVTIMSIIPMAIVYLLENFTDRQKVGVKLLAAIAFIVGVILSADSFYQNFSGGRALFPFYETNFIGWRNWFGVPFQPMFWVAIVISLGVAILEGFYLKGQDPDEALEKLNEVKHHVMPKMPTNGIQVVKRRARQYENSGTRSDGIFGLVVLLVFIYDITAALQARPFWGQPEMFQIALYNLFTIMSAETGYVVYRRIETDQRRAKARQKTEAAS